MHLPNRLLEAAAAIALIAVPATGAMAASNTPAGNIVAAAMSSKDHSTLVAAVKAAGLVPTLASGGPFTVFAPTDAAFAKLPDGTLASLLEPASRDTLAAILTYHLVPGRVTAEQLIGLIEAGGGSAMLTTVQGGKLTASLSGGNVIITDAKGGQARVTTADLVQSNGVIHVTDAVSLPM